MNRVSDDRSLLRGYEGRLLLTIAGGSLFVPMAALVIPPMMTVIIEEQGISVTQAGLIMTVWWLAVAAHTAPGGCLADALTHKTGLVIGLGLAIAGTFLLTNATMYPLLLVGLGVVGAGRGVYQSSAVGQISKTFTARRGQALGFRVGAFDFAGVLAGGLAAVVLSVATWRDAFLPILAALAVLTLWMHWWNRETYVFKPFTFDLWNSLRRISYDADVRLIVLSLSTFGVVWNGTTSFIPAYLRFSKGFSPTAASLSFSGLFLVGAIVSPLSGMYGDRVGHTSVGIASIIVCGVGLSGLILFRRTSVVLIALLVLAVGLAAFWPVTTALAVDLLSFETRAGDWGMITTLFLIMESLGSVYVGVGIEHASYTITYGSLLIFLGISLIALWTVHSRKDAPQYRIVAR